MSRFFLIFPSLYFIKTRLNTKAAILFHGYAEFLLGVIFLFITGLDIWNAFESFILGYTAFISVYEIGYIFNDFVSVKFEKNPRKRLEASSITNGLIAVWIIIRLLFFAFITYYLEKHTSYEWWIFYIILSFTFFLHNVLKEKGLKIFTFISLAIFRFYAPLLWFISKEFFISTLSGILLFYVVFRTLTYMDSKGLLLLPTRSSFAFKLKYYLMLLPVSGIVAIFSGSHIFPAINLYFLFFWGILYVLQYSRIILFSGFKAD